MHCIESNVCQQVTEKISNRATGKIRLVATSTVLFCSANAEIKTLPEVYADADAKEKPAKDFSRRFDLV